MPRRSHEVITPCAVFGLSTLVLLLAVAAAGAHPTFAATLGVDDPSSPGVVGDDRLSLSEAILLAGGQLSPLALSDAERARIDGEPGAGSADLIRVELGEGATLTTPGGAFFGLPQLMGNEGDVLDGGGAVLQPAGPLPTRAIGMFTVSSEIEVRRFSFDGYPFGLIVAGAPGSADLEEIRVSENTFSDYEIGVVVAPNPNGSKGLRRLSIDGNRFIAGAGSINAIVVLGASPRVPGEVAADYVVEDVVIRSNEIRGGFGGIAFFGGQPAPGTIVRDGRLAGLRIVGNDIRDVFDLSISVYAGFANRGGVVSGNELSDVEIAGNHIAGEGVPGTHIWVVSGAAVFEPGGLVENNLIRDVSIVRNRTSGGGEGSGGIQLQASQNEIGGGVVRGNLLEGVRVYDNSVSGCENGIGVFSGLAAAGRGLVEGNEIRDVLVLGNRLTDNRQGVNMISGLGLEGSALPLPSPEPALIRENLLHSIQIVGNTIRGGVAGILAIGGVSNFTSDQVVGNSLASGNEFDNDSQFPCKVLQDVVLGAEGGAATGNRAAFECSPPMPPKATGRRLRVTTLDDELNSDGDCSLREAIQAANTDAAVDACPAGRGADAIKLRTGTYSLTAGQLTIASDLLIRGAQSGGTVIDAARTGRVIHVTGWSVELDGLTIQNGLALFEAGIRNDGTLFLTDSIVRGNTAEFSNGGVGNLGAMVSSGSSVVDNTAVREFNGGVFNAAGARLTLADSTVSGNTASRSNGGIGNEGRLEIVDSSVTDNVATGEFQGGIWNAPGATLTLVNSAVRGNRANLSNGAINNAGTIEILGSSIVGNTAVREFNGGIFNAAGATLTLTNSTVSGNTANLSFGAIFSFGTVEIVNSTVSDNRARFNGGIFGGSGSSVTLKNSIVAGNAGRECTGVIVSGGHNLDSDDTCNLSETGDMPGVDPLLGPLADNGGPTETHALLPGSPAIDVIPVADCIDLDGQPVEHDQRGVRRPRGAGCDVGAFELRIGHPHGGR